MIKNMGFIFLIAAFMWISAGAATITGVVKEGDSTGAVIANAIVTISNGTGQTLTDTTDATGGYSLTNVRTGNRQIRASKTGYSPLSSPTVNVTDSTASYAAAVYLISNSIRATISGSVTDSVAATALANAKVTIRQGTRRDSVVTTETGTFSFDTIGVGQYTITVAATGYVSKTINGTVTSATVAPVAVKLAKPVTATVSGTVTDTTTAAAIAGAQVILRSGTAIRDTALTTATGAFSFANIGSGSFTITVTATGYASKSVNGNVTSATVAPIDVKLAAPISATVSGTVTDTTTAAAIAGAQVILRSGTTIRDTTLTSATGAFSFANIGTGSFTITVTATGYTSKSVNGNVTSATVASVAVKLAKPIVATVSGTVTDTTSAAAIAGAQVILRSGTIRDTALTSATGTFSFANIGSGQYTITISATGYASKTVNGNVTSATVPAIDVKLVKILYVSLSGTVTDSVSSTVIANAQVILRSGTKSDTVVTNASGAFTAANIASGNYTITVSAAGHVSRSISLAITGATPAPVAIKLIPITYGKITGVIKADSLKGAALPGATVILSLRSGMANTPIDTVVSGADGSYLFTNVESAQNYRISVSLTGYSSASANHNNQTAGTDTVNLALAKIGSGNLLVLVLKRTDSTVIQGATITAVSSGTEAATLTGTTDTKGTATFANIEIVNATLNFSITVSASGYVATSGAGVVPKNGSDTVKIYLASAATGSKLLKGVITDSVSKTPLANVRIILTITSGQSQLTFFDTTGIDGAYNISGLPLTVTRGTLSATDSGYRNYTNNNLALGRANTADTTTFNFSLQVPLAVTDQKNTVVGAPAVQLLRSGALQLINFPSAGTLKIFSINGKLLFKSTFGDHCGQLRLPTNIAISGNTLLISVTQNKNIYRKQLIVP